MNFLCFDPSISVERRLYSGTPSSLCIKFGVVWFFLSDIFQFILSTTLPRFPSTEWIVPFRERVRGLCVVVYILQEDRWQWKCRRRNLPATNFREQIFLEKWRGNKWKTQSWVYSGISDSNALCGVRGKIHRAFLFSQECLLWTKGKLLLLYQQYSCQLIFEKLTLS